MGSTGEQPKLSGLDKKIAHVSDLVVIFQMDRDCVNNGYYSIFEIVH